jgi:hypothetical protein
MSMKKKTFIALFILLIFLAACSPKMASQSENAYTPAQPQSEDSAGTGSSYDRSIEQVSLPEAQGTENTFRIVIKNASISIVVDDPSKVMEAIGKNAEQKGGFIVTSNLYKTQTDQGLEIPEATITVRVPAELLTQTLDEIKAMVKDPEKDVQYENVTGQDVTKDYTDLQSRLRNLQNTSAKLNDIMDGAVRTQDVLDVYNQLTSVNEQIEVIQGQIKYYDEAARLSAIDVHIVASESIQKLTIGGWQPAGVASSALQTLIDTMQFLANAAIWVGLYVLPVLLCLLIPVAIVYFVVRSILKRRKQKSAEQSAVIESTK